MLLHEPDSFLRLASLLGCHHLGLASAPTRLFSFLHERGPSWARRGLGSQRPFAVVSAIACRPSGVPTCSRSDSWLALTEALVESVVV